VSGKGAHDSGQPAARVQVQRPLADLGKTDAHLRQLAHSSLQRATPKYSGVRNALSRGRTVPQFSDQASTPNEESHPTEYVLQLNCRYKCLGGGGYS